MTTEAALQIILELLGAVINAQARNVTHINLDELREKINTGDVEALHQAIQAQE
jgi:hypothetical protein